jgi:putative addiction module CopG family antidote
MEVASVRLSDEEKRFIEQLIAQGKYSSVSEVLKAGLYELMGEEKLKQTPWQSREEVRRYFVDKIRRVKGLEDIHVEED